MASEFNSVLGLLQEQEVDFIVVGGVACALNGFVRTTEDLDILVRVTPENIDSLFAALSNWGEGFVRELERADFDLIPGAVRLVEDFPLDMFTLLAGKTYDDFCAVARATEDGLKYLPPAALIETKQGSVREKDRIDIAALRRILHQES
jgi:hypothetical protein